MTISTTERQLVEAAMAAVSSWLHFPGTGAVNGVDRANEALRAYREKQARAAANNGGYCPDCGCALPGHMNQCPRVNMRTADPAECRPPPEHEEERYHWIEAERAWQPGVCEWVKDAWYAANELGAITPAEMYERGYRWHSVAKPSTVEPISDRDEKIEILAEVIRNEVTYRAYHPDLEPNEYREIAKLSLDALEGKTA